MANPCETPRERMEVLLPSSYCPSSADGNVLAWSVVVDLLELCTHLEAYVSNKASIKEMLDLSKETTSHLSRLPPEILNPIKAYLRLPSHKDIERWRDTIFARYWWDVNEPWTDLIKCLHQDFPGVMAIPSQRREEVDPPVNGRSIKFTV